MATKDERMKKTAEVLNGIKYIKMCGLETKFIDSVCTKNMTRIYYILG